MGGVHANVLHHLECEFERVSGVGALPVIAEDASAEETWKSYDRLVELSGKRRLGYDQLQQLKQLESLPVDFGHVAVLFVLDLDKDGRVGMEELKSFALWCARVIPGHLSGDAFRNEVQSHAVVTMWRECQTMKDQAGEFFTEWMLQLLRHSKAPQARRSPRHSGSEQAQTPRSGSTSSSSRGASPRPRLLSVAEGDATLSSEQVAVLHELLSVEELYGLDRQSFCNLLFMASVEATGEADCLSSPMASGLASPSRRRGAPAQQYSALDLDSHGGVSEAVVDPFLRQFVASYFRQLSNLGLEPLLEPAR